MSRIIEQFEEKNGGKDKGRLLHFEGASDKQRLLMLKEDGLVTTLQTRALAARMDEGVLLRTALEELADGDLKVGARDPKAKKNLLSLSQLRAERPGMSRKEELLQLRNAGSLSPVQTREAAHAMTANREMTTEQALAKVGANHLLDIQLAEETPDDSDGDGKETGEAHEGDEGDGAEAVEADAGEGDGQAAGGSGEGSQGDGEPTEAAPTESTESKTDADRPLTLATFLDGSIKAVTEGLDKIKSKHAAIQLIILEEGGKTRVGLMPVLEDFARELGATDEEIAEARSIAQQSDGQSPEDTYEASAEEDEEE